MKYYLFNHAKGRQYYVFFGDVIAVFLAVALSYVIRIYINNNWSVSWEILSEKFTPWLLVVLIPHLFSLYLLGLYNLNRLINRFRTSVFIVLSVLLAGLIIGSIFFFLPRYVFGRQVLLIHLLVSSILLVCWRILFHEVVSGRDRAKRLAVIGDYEKIFAYVEEIKVIVGDRILLSAVCYTSDFQENSQKEVSVYRDVSALLAADDFDILIYDPLSNSFNTHEIQSIIETKYHGKVVFDFPSFYKNLTGKIPLQYIDGNWLLQQEGLQGYVSKSYVYMKRILDLLLAGVLILFLWPLGLLIALAIAFDSRGPVLFSIERIGLHRRPFQCLKFRTMVLDAEKESGPVFSSDNDPRITRVGRILRKSRLDELPQLLNIIKGELSFVGPRPIRKHFADKLSKQIPYYNIRFSVQPGLSGWAQVNLEYADTEQGHFEKFEYELFYIQNISFFLDIFTVLRTIKSVFHGEGK